jgi:hypothetical protein
MLDIFKNNAFGVVSLTTSINKLPNKPQRLAGLGIFTPKSITTTSFVVEEKHGKLSILSTSPRGVRGKNPGTRQTTQARAFLVPHIDTEDGVDADEVQNVRAFGSEDAVLSVAELVNQRLQSMKDNLDITAEFHRAGAIKGVVIDADGSTIYDWFDEFDIVETSKNIQFNVDDVKMKALEIKRTMRDALGNTPYQRIHALCGDDFFDALISADDVKSAFERQAENNFARTQQDGEGGFEFAGIIWENYMPEIGTTKFVDTNKCRFLPIGAPDLFQVVYAPADYIETVNTPGKAFYAKQAVRKFETGVDIEAQTNPLHICTRPAALIEGVAI